MGKFYNGGNIYGEDVGELTSLNLGPETGYHVELNCDGGGSVVVSGGTNETRVTYDYVDTPDILKFTGYWGDYPDPTEKSYSLNETITYLLENGGGGGGGSSGTFDDPVTFNNTVDFEDYASFNDTAIFNDSVSFLDTATFYHDVSFGDDISVAGGVDANGNISAYRVQASYLQATNATFEHLTAPISGDSVEIPYLNVGDTLTADHITAQVINTGYITATDTARFNDVAAFSGEVTFDDDVEFNGEVTFNDAVSFSNSLGDITVGYLRATDHATFEDPVTFESDVEFTNPISLFSAETLMGTYLNLGAEDEDDHGIEMNASSGYSEITLFTTDSDTEERTTMKLTSDDLYLMSAGYWGDRSDPYMKNSSLNETISYLLQHINSLESRVSALEGN